MSPLSFSHEIDRFDGIVLSLLLTMITATGLLLLRSDQVGVRVRNLAPLPDSKLVSTAVEIALTFDEPMVKSSVEERFRLEPETPGTFGWRGQTLVWRPRAALAADAAYTVTMAAGARSIQGRRSKEEIVWTFETRHPRVLYMSLGDASHLHAVDTDGRNAQQLTRMDDDSSVWDYAVSPDGRQIALGIIRPDSSAVDLWLMQADGSNLEVLLPCDQQQCSAVAWSLDGRYLAFERRDLNVDLGGVGSGLGPARVWLYDLNNDQATLLLGDSQMLGFAPRWSPDGERLAYFEPQAGVRVVELDTSLSQLIPNQSGGMGTWSPDGQRMVLADLAFAGERVQGFLVRAELTDGSIHQITGQETLSDDGSPNWSRDGEWIAFGRKALADGTPTAGQQLWLMRPDGTEAHSVATDPAAHFGSFSWSPDSRQVAYLRFPLLTANAYPSIWLLSLDDGESTMLVENGTLPGWLP